MKNLKILKTGQALFFGLSFLSLAYVALFALWSPQATMDLVNTPLPNTDALSSIRGVYGGVGVSLCIGLFYLWRRDRRSALCFLSIFWGLYAISRIITIFTDGPLGDFGNQWLSIELFLAFWGVLMLIAEKAPYRQRVPVR